MKVGFLWDWYGVDGGAELNMHALMSGAPDGVTVVDCPASRPLPACDVYVVGNCSQYGPAIIPALEGKRVVKLVYDLWTVCDDALRAWLLKRAEPVFNTPVLADVVSWRFEKPVTCIPNPLDLAPFRAARNGHERAGACWIGRMFASKGIDEAREWATNNGVTLDFYGEGPDKPADGKGMVSHEAVPQTLARYDWFVFLPREFDSSPRTIVEAWAAGCRIVTNANQGATWWIEHQPDALDHGLDLFWSFVCSNP